MRVENLIPLGVIPGPQSPKSLNSFFVPFVEEYLQLAEGVHTYDARARESFNMHTYPLTAFGDLPAMSKLLCLKGHNGYSPCRFCLIRGERMYGMRNKCYYSPLRAPKRPGVQDDDGWDPRALPRRTHENLQEHLWEINEAPTAKAKEKLSTHYGINSMSQIDQIPSLTFPDSFPHDIMHLLFENVCPMLRDHWTGKGRYQDKEPADDGYRLTPHIWEQIGLETAAAYKTIPSEFVGAMPDIAQFKYKAEYWSFWMIHLGLVLLRGRFPNDKYYRHYCNLVTIIKLCLQFTITEEELKYMEDLIIDWVEKYEQ
jgi:hypothetical protein